MKPVLITGARAPVSLDIARSFAAAGHEPVLADSIPAWTARLSGFRIERLSPPRARFEAFRAELSRLIDRLDPVRVVPTCEEVFFLAAAAARDGWAHRLYAPPLDLLRRLHSKVAFAELARAAGLEAPETRRVADAPGLAAVAPLGPDLVLKPEFSRFATHVLVRPAPVRVAGLEASARAAWAAQAFVPGEELCLWSACVAGEVTAFVAYRPRWRLGHSSSFYFERDDDPRLAGLARAVARATNATGQLAYDVIRTADGRLVPIECNPRAVSGVHLFGPGPGLAHAILGQGRAEPSHRARHLGPAMLMFGLPEALLSGRLAAYAADLRRSRDALGLAGGLGALIDGARFLGHALAARRSAVSETTSDIEWNGEEIE